MKKLFILTMLLGLLGVTGCGNTKEANVAETEMVTNTVYEETTNEEVEEVENYFTKEEFEEEMRIGIEMFKEDFENGDITEEFMNDMIDMIESIEYDSTRTIDEYEEILGKGYLKIMMEHDMIPEEYSEYTIDELYALVMFVS